MGKDVKRIVIIIFSVLMVGACVGYYFMIFHSDIPPENPNDWNENIKVQIGPDILDTVLDLAHNYEENAVLYGVSYRFAEGGQLISKSYLMYCPATKDLPNGMLNIFCDMQLLEISNVSMTYSENHVAPVALDSKLLDKTEENLCRKIMEEWEHDIYQVDVSLLSESASFTAYKNVENEKCFLWERKYNIVDGNFEE